MLTELLTMAAVFLIALAIGLIIERIRGPRPYNETDRLAHKQAARHAVRGTR